MLSLYVETMRNLFCLLIYLTDRGVQVLDAKHPGCTIRQIVAGPITDSPHATAAAPAAGLHVGRRASRALSEVTTDSSRRFSCRWGPPPADGGLTATGAGFERSDKSAPIVGAGVGNNSADPSGDSVGASTSSGRKVNGGGEGGVTQRGKAEAALAPGWDDGSGGSGSGGGGGSSGRTSDLSSGRDDSRASRGLQQSATTTTTTTMDAPPRRRQAKPVSAGGERSFLEAFLDGGHSPATAVAAGFDPAASARGVAALVVAEAVTVTFVGAMVVLGPVVGRVTQRSAVVLVEVGSTAAVGCVLTDGVTGRQHRQVWRRKK